jgi:hypothetical protein
VEGDIILGPSGSIEAGGVSGGYGTSAGGGGSGGGAIHIFHKGSVNDPSKITAIGAAGGGTVGTGGKGGNGTVNIVQV